jgi:hypothetical protein
MTISRFEKRLRREVRALERQAYQPAAVATADPRDALLARLADIAAKQEPGPRRTAKQEAVAVEELKAILLAHVAPYEGLQAKIDAERRSPAWQHLQQRGR